jgi:poly(3-hydroxybutyrate) depolymerase
MNYALYAKGSTTLGSTRFWIDATSAAMRNPFVPLSHTMYGRALGAAADVYGSLLRERGKPEWQIEHVLCDAKPFCRLLRFASRNDDARAPKVLLVAPMSGHYATLLRATVEDLRAEHDVYVTDWLNARDVPAASGIFDTETYVEYVMDFLRLLGPDVHVFAVCQPAPLVLAAVALLAARNDERQPLSMTLMGGPIDTRVAETEPTRLARKHSLDWFERKLISRVPPGFAGVGRRVYPGFVQLAAFVNMHPGRHVSAHLTQFANLLEGKIAPAEAHERFYDEYFSVMDLSAEFYLQTIEQIFQQHRLAKGTMTWRGEPVRPEAIVATALLTIEGERDDIAAPGQTYAAHALCTSLPANRRDHYLQAGAGHYALFNGRRWQQGVLPRFAAFVRDAASLRGVCV